MFKKKGYRGKEHKVMTHKEAATVPSKPTQASSGPMNAKPTAPTPTIKGPPPRQGPPSKPMLQQHQQLHPPQQEQQKQHNQPMRNPNAQALSGHAGLDRPLASEAFWEVPKTVSPPSSN